MRGALMAVTYMVLLAAAVSVLEASYVPGTLAPFKMTNHASLGQLYESLNHSALPHTTGMPVDVVASMGYTIGNAMEWVGQGGSSVAAQVDAALKTAGIDVGPLRGFFQQLGNPITEALERVAAALQGTSD